VFVTSDAAVAFRRLLEQELPRRITTQLTQRLSVIPGAQSPLVQNQLSDIVQEAIGHCFGTAIPPALRAPGQRPVASSAAPRAENDATDLYGSGAQCPTGSRMPRHQHVAEWPPRNILFGISGRDDETWAGRPPTPYPATLFPGGGLGVSAPLDPYPSPPAHPNTSNGPATSLDTAGSAPETPGGAASGDFGLAGNDFPFPLQESHEEPSASGWLYDPPYLHIPPFDSSLGWPLGADSDTHPGSVP